MAFDINRTLTDVFDFIANRIGEFWEKDSAPLPPLSASDIENLITDNDISSPEYFYATTDEVPDFEFRRKSRLPLLDFYEGRFPSPVQTGFPENNTVYAHLYRLRNGKSVRPVVVMINGLHVDTNFYFDWWCWRFAAAGMDSVLITMPYSIERVPAGSFSGQYIMTPDTMWTLLAVRQSFMDLNLLVNRLKADGYPAVGTFGASYGALMSGIYVCQAENADFAILGMPPVDFSEVISMWSFADELEKREAGGEATLLSDPRVPPLLSMCEMDLKIDRRKMFIARGVYDHLVTPSSIDRTARRWGGLPWLIDYPTGHINTFVLNPKFTFDVLRFVRKEVV